MTQAEVRQLQQSFLFKGIRLEELKDFLPLLKGELIKAEPKETLFSEGDKVTRIGSVLSGEVCLSKYDVSGREHLIQKMLPGYTVGANIACTPSQVSPYFCYAASSAKCYLFPLERVGKLPHEWNNAIYRNLMTYLANENIRKQHKIDVLSKSGARERILTYLYSQSDKREKTEFDIPFNREEMANYLCVNRSVLSHELSLMASEGILEFRKNHFKLLLK